MDETLEVFEAFPGGGLQILQTRGEPTTLWGQVDLLPAAAHQVLPLC